MPRPALQTRQQILKQAHRLFRKSGFFRTGMDEIAEASGVTKRTLYHHFDSKDALLAAVLNAQHQELFATREPYGFPLTGTPQEMMDRLFDGLVSWSGTPHWSGSGFTRLAMELADMPGHPARRIAHRHKAWAEEYLGAVLADAGVPSPSDRAKELILIIEGAMAMILIHGDSSYALAASSAAKKLFEVAGTDHTELPTTGRPRTNAPATPAGAAVPGTVSERPQYPVPPIT
jgi:AcrR family transcriptional regulator